LREYDMLFSDGLHPSLTDIGPSGLIVEWHCLFSMGFTRRYYMSAFQALMWMASWPYY